MKREHTYYGLQAKLLVFLGSILKTILIIITLFIPLILKSQLFIAELLIFFFFVEKKRKPHKYPTVKWTMVCCSIKHFFFSCWRWSTWRLQQRLKCNLRLKIIICNFIFTVVITFKNQWMLVFQGLQISIWNENGLDRVIGLVMMLSFFYFSYCYIVICSVNTFCFKCQG